MPWKKLLAWATGQIDETLRQKLDFVLEENRVYRALLDRHSPRWHLQDAECKVLAEKGKPLGKLLGEVITLVQPETLLKWHRQLVARKWDFSRRPEPKPGRPSVSIEIERLVLQFARENPGRGYDRIVGALANLGYHISDQTVGSILKRHGLGQPPNANATRPGPSSFAVLVCHPLVLFKEEDSCKMALTVGTAQLMCALPLAFRLTERFGSDSASNSAAYNR